jgi:hypothetical protein
VNGAKIVSTYLASLILPNNSNINEIELISCDDTLLSDILVGMDLISQGEFLFNTCKNITSFSFQMPAPTFLCLDLLTIRQDQSIIFNQTFNTAMLCPCGSNIPFTRCCSKTII